MKIIALSLVVLASCGRTPCQEFAYNYCLLSRSCGSNLSQTECEDLVARTIKSGAYTDNQCATGATKVLKGTCRDL